MFANEGPNPIDNENEGLVVTVGLVASSAYALSSLTKFTKPPQLSLAIFQSCLLIVGITFAPMLRSVAVALSGASMAVLISHKSRDSEAMAVQRHSQQI